MLNGYRRAVYERLVERVANIREEVYTSITTQHYNGNNDKIAVIATDFDGVKADIAIYKATDLTSEYPCSFTKGNFEKFVYYPAFCTAQDEDEFVVRMCKNGIDGVYVENYGGLVFAQKHNFKVFVGTGLNLINDVAIQQLLKLPNICYYVLSKEVNESETRGLITDKAFALTSGNIKIMDLCYCPFGKTCKDCDKKGVYTLTDEHGRQFPVRRYVDAKGVCRFEVYNCADLVSKGVYGAGKLLDATLVQNKACAILAITDETAQKSIYKNYTSGHYKRGVE